MLEKHFGKCTQTITDFTNICIHHQFLEKGVTMDQFAYINTLKPIQHPSMIGLAADKEVIEEVKSLFASLVGAIAYSLMTPSWVAVFIVALQRQLKRPQAIHVRRLNAVLRKMQQRPHPVFFAAMECMNLIDVHSDSGFSKEENKGYSIRGANTARIGRDLRTGRSVFTLA